MARVRVCVLGAGGNGRRWMEAYARMPQTELVAVSDLLEERATKAAAELGVPYAGTDLDLVERSGVDLVSIHTSDHVHVEPFVRALAA